MKIDREKSIKKATEYLEEYERKGLIPKEELSYAELDDHDLICLLGTYWGLNSTGKHLKESMLEELQAVIVERARGYVLDMMLDADVLAFEEDGQD